MKIIKVLLAVFAGLVIGGITGGVIAAHYHSPIVDDVDNVGNLVISFYGIATGAIIGAVIGLIAGLTKWLRKRTAVDITK